MSDRGQSLSTEAARPHHAPHPHPKPDLHPAEWAEISGYGVAGAALDDVAGAAGGDDVAGLQGRTSGAEMVGEPDQGVPWVAEDVASAPFGRRLAVAPHGHLLGGEVAGEPTLRRRWLRPRASPSGRPASKHGLDIRPGEIDADIEQGALGSVGELVGEAVAEIERGGVKAPAPLGIGVRHAARRRRVEGDDFEAGDQGFHPGSRSAAVGDRASATVAADIGIGWFEARASTRSGASGSSGRIAIGAEVSTAITWGGRARRRGNPGCAPPSVLVLSRAWPRPGWTR